MPRPGPCICCGGGSGPPPDDCPIRVCWTVYDAGTGGPLSGATVILFGPDDEQVGVQVTGPDGRACFNLPDGPPGEYVVAIGKLCFLDAGGPVTLECDQPDYEFEVDLSRDPDACYSPGGSEVCGCTGVETLIIRRVLVTFTANANWPGGPFDGTSYTLTLNTTTNRYESGILAIDYTYPMDGPLVTERGVRYLSAQINVACGFSNTFAGPGFNASTRRGAGFTGASGPGRIANVLTPDGSTVPTPLNCQTEAFSVGYYFGNPPSTTPPYPLIATVSGPA